MSFRPEEVSAILAQELERYEAKLETKSVGSVLSVGDGIARGWGLEDGMAGELLKFPGDVMGMVLNLEEDNVGAVLFGSDKNIKEGDRVERTGRIASVPVGKAMIGRVVNAIGRNPSVTDTVKGTGLFYFALVEAIALFALVIALLLLFVF